MELLSFRESMVVQGSHYTLICSRSHYTHYTLTHFAKTNRTISPRVFVVSPLNPTRVVAHRMISDLSMPIALSVSRKMTLAEQPPSITTFVVRQFPIVSWTIKPSWCFWYQSLRSSWSKVIFIASSSYSSFDLADCEIGWSPGPCRACLLAAEYVRPQTSEPLVIQFTTFACSWSSTFHGCSISFNNVFQMPFQIQIRNLLSETDAIVCHMAMIVMEVAPFGLIFRITLSIGFLWPSYGCLNVFQGFYEILWCTCKIVSR